MPPFVASEVSTRLLSLDARMREMFNLESVDLSGDDLEKFMVASWLVGYAEGVSEDKQHPSALLEWLLEETTP